MNNKTIINSFDLLRYPEPKQVTFDDIIEIVKKMKPAPLPDLEFEIAYNFRLAIIRNLEKWCEELRKNNDNFRYILSEQRNKLASDLNKFVFDNGRQPRKIVWLNS